jgi:hypothetical protein
MPLLLLVGGVILLLNNHPTMGFLCIVFALLNSD